jgi:hypothetical protein
MADLGVFGAFFAHSDHNPPMAAFLARAILPRCPEAVIG